MIEIRIEDSGIPERLRDMARTCEHPRRPLVALGGHWVRRVKKAMPSLGPLQAAPAGMPPGVHTTEYSHSIFYDVPASGEYAKLGSSSERARLLHEGGVIVPRRAQSLTIPIAAESYGKRVRDFPGITRTSKATLGFRRPGREPLRLFALAKSATIRPHPHITIEADDWAAFETQLQRDIETAAGGNA
jgi:hypothetical protein